MLAYRYSPISKTCFDTIQRIRKQNIQSTYSVKIDTPTSSQNKKTRPT